MIVLLVLLIICAPYVVTWLLHDQQAGGGGSARARRAGVDALRRTPPVGAQASTFRRDGLSWTDLDDRQLTRLLSDAAPQTDTDHDL